MLNIKVNSVVHTIVNQFLVEDELNDHNTAIYICIDCRLSFSGDESLQHKTLKASCGLHLLYYKKSGTYITVFSGVTDSPFTKVDKVDNWKHETTHDSCWRDIPIFSQVYFELANKVNAQRVELDLPEIAPIRMHESSSFAGINGPLFRRIPVEIKTDPNDPNRYKKIVKLL